jgi:hypothetical protein
VRSRSPSWLMTLIWVPSIRRVTRWPARPRENFLYVFKGARSPAAPSTKGCSSDAVRHRSQDA